MTGTKASIIPRYSWDYGLHELVRALGSLARDNTRLTGVLQGLFRDQFGTEPLLTTSGRASLWAILRALDLPAGSRIGVPLFCCPVVFEVIIRAGFVPEFIDIQDDDYTISPEDVQRKRKGLAAVVVVHMFGNPADVAGTRSAGGGLPLVEDCAQALLSRRCGEYVGFTSDASFFSFRSGKYISAGEGSAIFCGDGALSSALRKIIASFPEWTSLQQVKHCIGTFGKSLFYRRPLYGLLGRSLGAALDRRLNLTAKSGIELKAIAGTDGQIIADRLAGFTSKIEQQRKNAMEMIQRLSDIPIVLPREKDSCTNNYYQFVVRFGGRSERDSMHCLLSEAGIDTAQYLDDVVETARRDYGYTGGCPVAERCSQTILSIPHYYRVSNEIERISNKVIEAHRSWTSTRRAAGRDGE